MVKENISEILHQFSNNIGVGKSRFTVVEYMKHSLFLHYFLLTIICITAINPLLPIPYLKSSTYAYLSSGTLGISEKVVFPREQWFELEPTQTNKNIHF